MVTIQHDSEFNFYYIDGQAYASQRGIARLTGYTQQNVNKGLHDDSYSPVKMAEIPTAHGVRDDSLLYSGDVVSKWLTHGLTSPRSSQKVKQTCAESMMALAEIGFTAFVINQTGASNVELQYHVQNKSERLARLLKLREMHKTNYMSWISRSGGIGMQLRDALNALTDRFFPGMRNSLAPLDGDWLPDRLVSNEELDAMEDLISVRSVYFSKPGLTHEQRCALVAKRLSM